MWGSWGQWYPSNRDGLLVDTALFPADSFQSIRDFLMFHRYIITLLFGSNYIVYLVWWLQDKDTASENGSGRTDRASCSSADAFDNKAFEANQEQGNDESL